MRKYNGKYCDEIKRKLKEIYGFSDEMEIYTFLSSSEIEYYVQDYYSDYYSKHYRKKTLTKIDKRIIYYILREILIQQKHNNISKNGKCR